MISSAVLVATLGAALAAPQQAPQEGFASKQARGVTLHYSLEMTPQDADGLLNNLTTTRDALQRGLGIGISDPIVQVRQRKGARKAYFTDGEDRVFFDFPSQMYFVRIQFADPRVLRYSVPSFLQLWLFKCLSSTAGLDPRILESLTEYAMYVIETEKAKSTRSPLPEPPTGPGRAWYQLEFIHPGATVFVLNHLGANKTPGHALGQTIREAAISATLDEQIGKLFDSIAPVEPLLAPEDVEPGPLVNPALPLKPGRLTLFNGVPMLDAEGEQITALDRAADFDMTFDMVTITAPDARIVNEPPSLRGIDLWPLYFEFRPRILRARDNLDYILVLREFLGRFKDRAVALRPTPALPVLPGSPFWCSVFGAGFTRIDDRIHFAKVTEGTEPHKAGLVPGLELVSVDGRPAALVHDLLAEVIQTFDSCPTRQRAEAAALDFLLTGPQGGECTIEVRDPRDDTARTFKFTRALPPPPKAVPFTVEHHLREDKIGVIRVRFFMGDALQRFVTALEELKQQGAVGLVIDLRVTEGVRDPRSPSSVALGMLSRLLPPASGKLLIGSAIQRERETWNAVRRQEIVVSPTPAATSFEGPVAVLTDAWTGNEAEVFTLGFRAAKRGVVVGTSTAGNVTSPMDPQPWQALSRSRVELIFPSSAVVKPDDSPIQGVGLAPEIVETPTWQDLFAGKDTVLERAAAAILASAPQVRTPAKEELPTQQEPAKSADGR